MGRIEKILEKMRNQPRGITYEEAAKVLESRGYVLVRSNGSHRVFRNDAGNVFVLKEKNPLKISYITEILERLGE